MKKSESINALLVTTAGKNTAVLSYGGKFKGFDFESDLLNIWYVSELSEEEARDLLKKKEDTCFLLHFGGKLGATDWRNTAEGYAVPVNPDEAEIIERFFNTEFQPKSFKSRKDLYSWSLSSEEGILLDKVFKIWWSKESGKSSCRIIKRELI